jgi:hypothetical protein
MSIFQSLNEEYSKWRERNRTDEVNSRLFVKRFVEGFRSFIEAPEGYKSPLKKENYETYVTALKLTDIDDEFYKLEEPANEADLICREVDGLSLLTDFFHRHPGDHEQTKQKIGFIPPSMTAE